MELKEHVRMNAIDTEAPEEYRNSPIDALPEKWDEKTLLDALGMKNNHIVSGPFGSNLKVSDYMDEGIPIIRLQNIDYGKFVDKDIKYISTEKAKELAYHSFRAGDLVLAKLGDPIGKTCIVPDYFRDGIVVSDVVRIRVENGLVDKKFIMYSLNSVSTKNQLINGTIGSTRPRVNLDQIRDLHIFVPPLNEQRKIAAILSNIDAAIEQTDAIISQTERMKKGLIQGFFTKSIENTKFKNLSALARTFSGGTPLKANRSYFNGAIPWVKSGELNSGVITSTNECISEEGLENSSAKWVSENSILIAMYGATAGTVALLKIRATINQAILAVVPNDQMFYLYLYYYLSNALKKIVGTLTQGSGQPNLNAGIIKKILVPCPPLSEQYRVSTILSAVDLNLVIKKKYREQLEMLKRGLMQDLLTGKVRVTEDADA